MREIKFRCWFPGEEDGEGRGMYVPEYTGFPLTNESECRMTTGDEFLSGELIWLQYVGLTDKNGVEIYEGDIVKEPDNSNGLGSVSPALEVKIRDYLYLEPFGYMGFYEGDSKRVVVLGNIYENKELLDAN